MRRQNIFVAVMVGLGLGASAAWGQTPGGQTPRVQRLPAPPTSFLGVGLQEISSERAKELKLPDEAGVEITSVERNSPAATAGLKTGDVILQYNGQRVEGAEQFSRMVRETPAGREVKLQIFRNGGTETVTAKIGSHISPLAEGPRPNLVFPTVPPRFAFPERALGQLGGGLGIQAEAVDGQLADYFGVKAGVLVRSVAKGSAAEKAGIKAGDVITRVGDMNVSTPAEVTARLRLSRNQAVSLNLMRDHREVTVNVNSDAPGPAERF